MNTPQQGPHPASALRATAGARRPAYPIKGRTHSLRIVPARTLSDRIGHHFHGSGCCRWVQGHYEQRQRRVWVPGRNVCSRAE